MKLITKILVTAFALLLVASYVPGIAVVSLTTAVIAALVLGILNAIVRPIIVILTLPVTILTLGLFLLVINAAFFGLAASLVPGFAVAGFLPALVGSVILSIVGMVTQQFLD